MSDERPMRWPGDEPAPGAQYGPVSKAPGATPDQRRIAERRERHAQEDRAAMMTPSGRRTVVSDRPWSALAVVAFVLSLFVPPVGLVLGIIGLFLVDDREARGRALAGWAVATGAVFSVIGLAVYG